MRTRFAAVAAFAALLSSSGLACAEPVSGTATPVADNSLAARLAADREIICRNQASIDSLIPHRVCRTRGQWDSMTRSSREFLLRIQRDSYSHSNF